MSSCPYAQVQTVQITTSNDGPENSNSNNSNDEPTNSTTTLSPQLALQLAKSSCPAFKSECPFRDVHDADGMKEALASMPPSHTSLAGTSVATLAGSSATTSIDSNEQEHEYGDGNGNGSSVVEEEERHRASIRRALSVSLGHVHNVSLALRQRRRNEEEDGGKYEIAGGCPFKSSAAISPTGSGENEGVGEEGEDVSFANVMEDLSFTTVLAKLLMQRQNEGTNGPAAESDEDAKEGTVQAEPTTTTTTTEEELKESSTATNKDKKRPTLLSTALKNGTAESHSSAESVHFVKEFIKGNVDRTLYSLLLRNLYFVYRALERKLEEKGPIHFPSLHFPEELEREGGLREDVEFFCGDGCFDNLDLDDRTNKVYTNDETVVTMDGNMDGGGRIKMEPSPATSDYIRRILYIAEREPILLLAHAYTRYLGDLSGGKVLARVAKRALNLSGGGGEGLRFYRFDKIPSAKKFKDGYRRALDEDLNLTPGEVERLVAEANVAFVMNMRIFEELDVLSGVVVDDGNGRKASVRPVEDALIYYDSCIEMQKKRMENGGNATEGHVMGHGSETKKEEAKCPFAALGGPNPHGPRTTDGARTPIKTPIRITATTPINTSDIMLDPKTTKSSKKSKQAAKEGGRCPWPFVFFHDPMTGMQDYQTWIVLGLLLAWIMNKYQ